MLNLEHQEILLIHDVEQVLQRNSAIPYNNATNVYERAGIDPEVEFGGSCLFKLSKLMNSLPSDVKNKQIILSEVGRVTHFAMLADVDNATYYLDPFLWQKTPLKLSSHDGTRVETIQSGLVIRKEPTQQDSFLSISLIDTSQIETNVLITHNFTKSLDFLPNSAALPITPQLPSYSMQIPDSDRHQIYKVWYLKNEGILGDIWVSDTVTGKKTKVPNNGIHSEMRGTVIQSISSLIGKSEQDINNFFTKARELELTLSQLVESSGVDVPHEGN